MGGAWLSTVAALSSAHASSVLRLQCRGRQRAEVGPRHGIFSRRMLLEVRVLWCDGRRDQRSKDVLLALILLLEVSAGLRVHVTLGSILCRISTVKIIAVRSWRNVMRLTVDDALHLHGSMRRVPSIPHCLVDGVGIVVQIGTISRASKSASFSPPTVTLHDIPLPDSIRRHPKVLLSKVANFGTGLHTLHIVSIGSISGSLLDILHGICTIQSRVDWKVGEVNVAEVKEAGEVHVLGDDDGIERL